ncbi:Iron sulfur domain protein-containing, CDGSH-type domain protein [mine drainage metagenome]|uniref:Iron sulfur domain protein-containing, CDGSH-type domain protein n=2 Tax=mine drainage metagenome TaxID=410659 RepID=T0YDI9_9ZZZZ
MTKVEIQAVENGPYLVMVDGKVVTALCRCGHSSKKPNCDGAHRTAGFQAVATNLPVISA